MLLKVNPHKIEIVKEPVNEKEINITSVEFEFAEEITEDYVKEAYFTLNSKTYKQIIINNQCNIPYEVLNKQGQVEIGVVAYLVENEEEIKRYNPSPAYFDTWVGSLKDNAENSEPITPTDKEQIEQAIQNNINSINELENTKIDKVEGKDLSTNDYTNEEKTKLASLENYDDTEIRGLINEKQDPLTAGENITIKNNVISATGKIATEWGNITGTLSNQTDLQNVLNSKAKTSDIPTALADLSDDSTHRLVSDTEKTTWNNKSDFSGNYNDLTNKPDLSLFITKNVNDLTYYTLKTNTGSLIDLEINSSTYVITLSLKDIDGNVISTDTIDLPLESVVVSGSFDSVNKKIVLTLQNGNTVDIPVGDLVAGLQTEITSTNKLNADYIDDTNSGNKFTNTSEKTTWNAKYDKPSGGIPSTDLASAVQTSLGKADTALQSDDLTDYVKNTDYANASTGGVFKTSNSFASEVYNGYLLAQGKTYAQYESLNNNAFISKQTLENVITGKDLTTKSYVDGLVGDINTALDTINGEVI